VKKQFIWTIFAIGSLGAAMYSLYFPAHTILNSLMGKLPLSGYQTEFILSSVNMQDQHGEKKTWQSFSDKPLFLTTGFTTCQLTCPNTMRLYQSLEKRTPNRARYALLTVDPKNDTEKQLAQHLNAINPEFIGLRINDSTLLTKILSELHQTTSVSNAHNNIEHNSFIYMLHPKLSGLVIYTEPTISRMIEDLNIIDAQELNNNE